MEKGTLICAYRGKLYKLGEFHPGNSDIEKVSSAGIYTLVYKERKSMYGEPSYTTVYYIGYPDHDFNEDDYDYDSVNECDDEYEDIKPNAFAVDLDYDEPSYISFTDDNLLGWFEMKEIA